MIREGDLSLISFTLLLNVLPLTFVFLPNGFVIGTTLGFEESHLKIATLSPREQLS